MNLRIFFALLLCFCSFGAVTARADEAAKLLQGYGKFRWGQSLAEVDKLYPGGNHAGSELINSKADAATGLPPGEAFYSSLFVTAPEPLQRLEFGFQDDQLYSVTLVFSKLTAALRNGDQIAEELWKKYCADPAVPSQLAGQQIYIYVQALKPGVPMISSRQDMERYKHPSKAEDLVFPFRGENLTVSYVNEGLRDKIEAKHKEARQQAIEAAAKNLNLSDVL